ncbi:MAG: ABC transporter ATP-binding protein [Phycisphaeraceae bacterium]|nr:ABC transporter ATP-binding protein [Phycisphaerae bacterium]MBX3391572.1 ABC transporter ATP-binding protein [Phycisphaeraceae bacterium]HRJ50140.1 ABC transporter ATP-binding protein [Phycisphaerales bacterium]
MVISVENLTRAYGSRRGVENVDLSIPRGSLYGFLGPNGAGKTTTIRVLLGFLRPTCGKALVMGMDCWSDSRRVKHQVGYIPGDLRLYPWLTGHLALSLFGSIRGMDLRGRGRDLAEMFDLDLSVKVRRMSRGMRQKLGLILSLAPDPALLILDEPTSGLDPLMQDRLQDHLRSVARSGRTVFFSSHTLGEVERLCERVAIVRNGRIVADDTLEALRRRAGHEVEILWRGPPSGDPPAGLRLDERTDAAWKGMYHGPVSVLLTWIAARGPEDVVIKRPDLETLFRSYYQTDERGPTDERGGHPSPGQDDRLGM